MSSQISNLHANARMTVSTESPTVSNSKLGNEVVSKTTAVEPNKSSVEVSGKILPQRVASSDEDKESSAQVETSHINELVKKIEQDIQHTRREIKFEVHDELGTPIVSVLDQDTKKVIRQFPPEEVIAMAERVAEMDSGSGGKLFNSIV